jgi:hypothetical protein
MVRYSSIAGLMILLGTVGLGAGAEDEVLKAGDETVAALRRSIDELRELNRQRRADPEAELRGLQEELAGKRAELIELREESRQLTSDMILLEERTAAWIREWRDTRRQIAVGERYPSIETLDERVYKDVEIVAVTGAGIEIRHADGTARIRCGQMPAEWAERFVWSASEQRGVLAAEREQAAELDRQVAARMELKKEQEEKRLAAEKAAESRAALARLRLQTSVAANSVSSSPLAEPPRRVSSGTYYYRRWNDWNRRYCSPLHYRRASNYSSYPSYSNCRSFGAGSRPQPISGIFKAGCSGHTNASVAAPQRPSPIKIPDPPKR